MSFLLDKTRACHSEIRIEGCLEVIYGVVASTVDLVVKNYGFDWWVQSTRNWIKLDPELWMDLSKHSVYIRRIGLDNVDVNSSLTIGFYLCEESSKSFQLFLMNLKTSAIWQTQFFFWFNCRADKTLPHLHHLKELKRQEGHPNEHWEHLTNQHNNHYWLKWA